MRHLSRRSAPRRDQTVPSHGKREAPRRLQFPFRRVLIQRDELVGPHLAQSADFYAAYRSQPQIGVGVAASGGHDQKAQRCDCKASPAVRLNVEDVGAVIVPPRLPVSPLAGSAEALSDVRLVSMRGASQTPYCYRAPSCKSRRILHATRREHRRHAELPLTRPDLGRRGSPSNGPTRCAPFVGRRRNLQPIRTGSECAGSSRSGLRSAQLGREEPNRHGVRQRTRRYHPDTATVTRLDRDGR